MIANMNLKLPVTNIPIKTDKDKQLAFYNQQNYQYTTSKLLDGPPYANGDIHMGHVVNKLYKDFIARKNNQVFRPGWDCHGLPIELAVSKKISKPSMDDYKNYASEQVSRQIGQFRQLGIYADFNNPYTTMSEEYTNHIKAAFEKLSKDGYIYTAMKPVHWSHKLNTSIADTEVEYKTELTTSIYFPLLLCNGTYLLVWTTTPWTIAANEAIAIGPFEYTTCVGYDGNLYVVAKSCAHRLIKDNIVQSCRNDTIPYWQLSNLSYSTQFTFSNHIYVDDMVSAINGTGIVHISPYYGKEDCDFCIRHNVHFNKSPTNPNDVFTEYLGPIVATEDIAHNNAYCSRSGGKVTYQFVNNYFLDISRLKNEFDIETIVNNIEFYPKESKTRFLKTLMSRTEWCISRNRHWGVSIPNSQYVLDVWFDSGVAFLLQKDINNIVIEGNDQHRGWFQSLFWLSLALNKTVPFTTVVTHGFVLDEHGNKMSKSKGNVLCPSKCINNYDIETLRCLVSSIDITKDMCISKKSLDNAQERYRKLRNTLRYLTSHTIDSNSYVDGYNGWVLNYVNNNIDNIAHHFNHYNYHNGMSLLHELLSFLNSYYINQYKDTLYCRDGVKRDMVVVAMRAIASSILQSIRHIFPYLYDEFSQFISEQPVVNYKYDYSQMLEVVNQFNINIAKLIDSKIISSALEVGIYGYFPEQSQDMFVVGYVSDIIPTDNILCEFTVNKHKYIIFKSQLNKCERCWKHNAVGKFCENCLTMFS